MNLKVHSALVAILLLISSMSNAVENECRLVDYTISFEELKLHHIHAPRSLNIGLAVGSCSHNTVSLQSYDPVKRPAHAMLQAGMAANDKIAGKPEADRTPEPQCVATKFEDATVLTLELNGEVKQTVLKNVIATEVGCR